MARLLEAPRPRAVRLKGAPLTTIQRVGRVYFALLLALTLVIGLEHFLVPADLRVPLLTAVAGSEYARVQLPAFAAHARLMAVHGIAGLVFVTIAPFQLWSRLRHRHPTLHRTLGVLFVTAAATSTLTGVAVAGTLLFSGRSEPVPNIVVSVLILSFMVCAVRSALRRDFTAHREWMLRAVALGIGIGLARVYLFGLVHLAGFSSREALGQALWLGSGTNLVLTEAWINMTRPVRRGAVAPVNQPRTTVGA